MSRIIMLIPLDENVGLTTISLSMIYLFNKNTINTHSHQSILYFSCIKNKLDNVTLIINKYFSNIVHTLQDIDFSEFFFESPEYLYLFNKIMHVCHEKKSLYELILIKGLNKNTHMHSDSINYDLAQNLNAEIILVENLQDHSLEAIQNKEKKINCFLHHQKYKKILGVVFNKVNSPFILKQKDSFTNKLIILKKYKTKITNINILKKCFQDNNPSIIACIPWNKDILKTHVVDIVKFLNIKHINLIKKSTHIIEEIIIFDQSNVHILNKKYANTLIIVNFSRIKNLIEVLKLLDCKKNKIRCIIFTETLVSQENIMNVCEIFIQRSISILFTKINTIDILYKLQNFNFNIRIKDKTYIQKLQKFISGFFHSSYDCFLNKNNNYVKTYAPKEFCYYIKLLSQKKNKRIILPESYEIRILKAVSICDANNIAQCVLLGNAKKIHQIAYDNNIYLSNNIEIINPILIKNQYITRLIEIRKNKGMNESIAQKQIEDNTMLATLILEDNKVDGLVSGSVNTTANTIRPALQIIKTNFRTRLVSSIFFMLLPNTVLIYGDCAINVDPNAEELAEIAIQSANSSKTFGFEPRIAMLSYSTGNSGHGYKVEKVRKATEMVKNMRSDLIIDGPIQYDAAISETVAKLKAPLSPISGSANIFIFPDLNSANIAYKAVQRSANIVSVGPMLQGLKKPVNDLSRGASVEDIVYTIALTVIQCK